MRRQRLVRQITVWLFTGLVSTLAAGPALADMPIVPDAQAPASQQPLVQEAANGVPLVQITAPTAGGVSRNRYADFNVPERGAVLNNSYTPTQTQLAGYVQGNPHMNRGTAKVIVNEVTSGRPTALNGFMEVAGRAASVVVANPDGIRVNGGGFINTSRAVLTTGRPQYGSDGSLRTLQVAQGTVRVDGKGLDARGADSLTVLTRAAEINAGIWAKEAGIVTGANDIDYDTGALTVTRGKDGKPEVALDVAAIGGMYANRIYLIGTEKGLGVRTAGTLIAAGDIVLEADGSLHARKDGRISGENVTIKAGEADNEGLIAADKKVSIQAATIVNRGTGKLYGGDIALQGTAVTNRKDEALEKELERAVAALGQAERELDEAYGADITKFTAKEDLAAYNERIETASRAYDTRLQAVKAVTARMNEMPSPVMAARKTLTVNAADKVVNAAGAMLYSGRDMHLRAGNTITNKGAVIESLGAMTLAAPVVENTNGAFSAKRIGGAWTTNPNMIRIDQYDHPERGRIFAKDEFSSLGSGYGAHHHGSAMEQYAPAYDRITQPTAEEIAAGAQPVPEEEVGKKIVNYEWNDPIFTTLGVTPMESARPAEEGAPQAAWDTRFAAILEELQEKITAHNAEAVRHNAALGETADAPIHDYTVMRTESQASEKVVQTTNDGLIRSGDDMAIEGSLINDNSRMISGKTLHVTGAVDNRAAEKHKQTVTVGTAQASYTYKRRWPHKSRRRGYKAEVFLTPDISYASPEALGVAAYKDHVPLEAGAEVPVPAIYTVHPESTAAYVIETDPAFTNRKRFLSSDYMYGQMRWDPDKLPKRLGDGFYEQGLIRDQILNRTGKRYLDGYTDDEAMYKALMQAGITYAEDVGLSPGVSLSKEQAAALTADMVWLETKTVTVDGKARTVLYPRVYLQPNTAIRLLPDGSLISAGKLVIDTKEAVKNAGLLQGDTVHVRAGKITNTGDLAGSDIALHSSEDIRQDGRITGKDRVTLTAGRNVTMDTGVTHLANEDTATRTAGIAVTGPDGVLIVSAGKDIRLAGAALQALGEKGAVVLKAGRDVTLAAKTLSMKKDMTADGDNYLRMKRQSELGTTLTGKGGVTVEAGRDIKARAAAVYSKDGAVTLSAGRDIGLTAGKERSVDDYGLTHKEHGLMSSSATTTRTHDDHERVLGTVVAGKTVTLQGERDIAMTAATVAGKDGAAIDAGRRLTTGAAARYDREDTYHHVKESGIMGAGLGLFIGTKKTKDTYDGEFTTHVGTAIVSADGAVSLHAGDTARLTGTDVSGKTGVSLTAQDITLDGVQDIANEKRTHEESQSGLTVSVSSPVVSAAEGARSTYRTATSRDNGTLKLLELGEGIKDLRKTVKDIGRTGTGRPGIHVGIGSSSYKQAYGEERKTYVGGNISGAHIHIAADSAAEAKGTIHATGESLRGKDVTLHASRDIRLDAGENVRRETTDYTSKGASVGVTFTGGTVTGADASFSKAKETGVTEQRTYTGTTVLAAGTLKTTSGTDTVLIGSQIGGNRAEVRAGRNLTVESLQDRDTYRGNSSSIGGGISYAFAAGQKAPEWLKYSHLSKYAAPYTPGRAGAAAAINKGKIESDYIGVTEQAGIYAGDGGFAVNVGDTTHLKGAVIGSTASAEKNSLTTGHLVMEDIQNSASYKLDNKGIAYNKYAGKEERDANYNKTGLTPDVLPGVQKDVHTATKSAIAWGTITTTKEDVDLTGINRDTANALNQLGKIFDKKKLEERQLLAKEFGEITFKAIGDYAAYRQRHAKSYEEWKAWQDGGANKVMLHALVGGVMSKIGGGSFKAGSFGAGVNELVQKELRSIKDPAVRQWTAFLIGGATNVLIGETRSIGSAAALSGTKWNYLTHEEFFALNAEYYACKTEEERDAVLEKCRLLDEEERPSAPIELHPIYGGEGIEATVSGLNLDDHAKKMRKEAYESMVNEYNDEFDKQKNVKIYDSAKRNKAALELLEARAELSKKYDMPLARDLLNVFLDHYEKDGVMQLDYKKYGITNVEHTKNGYPIFEFGKESNVNRVLRENVPLSILLVSQTIRNVGNKGVKMPTFMTSNRFYLYGKDLAFGLGSATSIVTIYKISPDLIAAKITITDNWDHGYWDVALGDLFEAAYLVQQSGLRKTYAFKTTYDVILPLKDVEEKLNEY
ncbi:two-partner secretion domain-containing protein [Colibacter massiliensis]|uniref:two-partner secretion domain-containing protein n=1 Tax=Colibacter massiliensis TaxID=1852379 RepID=UPI003F93EC12